MAHIPGYFHHIRVNQERQTLPHVKLTKLNETIMDTEAPRLKIIATTFIVKHMPLVL